MNVLMSSALALATATLRPSSSSCSASRIAASFASSSSSITIVRSFSVLLTHNNSGSSRASVRSGGRKPGPRAASSASAEGTGRSSSNDLFRNLQGRFTSAFSTSTMPRSSPYFTVAVTGSSGMVANAIFDELASADRRGKLMDKPVKIIRLVREESPSKTTTSDAAGIEEEIVTWDPTVSTTENAIDLNVLKDVDAVINLAGENIATGRGPLGFLGIRPWTDEKKQAAYDSRIPGTRALADAIRRVADADKSRRISFLSASAIGVYGYDFIEGVKDTPADETYDTSSTKGFLAELGRQWEEAANTASKSGGSNVRVVNLRFGVVLSRPGGALGKLLPIFRLGGGGNVGSGGQYYSFVSGRDVARAIVHCLQTPELTGPVNIVSPQPCTNAKFTKALGKVLHRPTVVPLPSFAVTALFGQMGEEMLLGGQKIIPSKLQEFGFEFRHETIDEALQSSLNEENI